MKTFCLIQDRGVFDEICSIGKLSCQDGFNVWRYACMYKYGWGDGSEFVSIDARLSTRALGMPSKSTAVDLIHVFYATGEVKYIDLFYQMMGCHELPEATRRDLTVLYRETRGLYQGENPGPEAVRRLGLRPDVVDFSYFDNAVEQARAEKSVSQ